MNGTVSAVLALLSDGQPRSTTEIFRRLYESRIGTVRADLPTTRGSSRLQPLVDEELVEPVGDRANSFFITRAGRDAHRAAMRLLDSTVDDLVERLTRAIEEEIGDAAQARMFADSRLRRVLELLSGLADDPHRAGRAALLQVAIGARLGALLSAPRGDGHAFMKAVHDQLTDYYYSQLMTLLHDEGARAPIDVGGLGFVRVADGLEHAELHTSSRHGPLLVNVLRLDPGVRTVEVEDVSRRTRDERYITAIATRTRALAVVSAGYFIFSEKGYEAPTRQFDPVGLCVIDGRITQPPVFLRGALWSDAGGIDFERVGLAHLAVALPSGSVPIAAVNDAPREAEDRLLACNAVWGRAVEAYPGEVLLTVVNGEVVARGQGSALVPLNGFVLRIPPALATAFRGLLGEELPLVFRAARRARARHAVAAGPMLLEEGRFAMNYAAEDFQEGTPPVTFSGDRTIDRNLIPRCGIGVDERRRVLVAIVDGRQPGLSVGATLVEFATLMRDLGCRDALNLDGGGTAAMQVGDRVVSNPSTSVRIDGHGRAEPARTNAEKNVRPLATALLIR